MKKVLLYQILVFTIHVKNRKRSYNNDKFKISAPTWNDKLELPDGSYYISDIQGYFEYILKNDIEKIDNLSIRICANTMENRITFKIKTWYYYELLTTETMKLLGSNEKKITDKNSENVPPLQITEVILVHCNVNGDYQQDSRTL